MEALKERVLNARRLEVVETTADGGELQTLQNVWRRSRRRIQKRCTSDSILLLLHNGIMLLRSVPVELSVVSDKRGCFLGQPRRGVCGWRKGVETSRLLQARASLHSPLYPQSHHKRTGPAGNGRPSSDRGR